MPDTNFNLRLYPMTVVIATLGGPSLKDTLETLNRGSIVPDEILICIPISEASRVENFPFRNARVLVTNCRGQVAQRAVGFQHASHDIVMQLDDDVFVDVDCVEQLIKTLKTYGPFVSVAPALMNISTGESTYKKPKRNKILQKIYYWIINGSDGYQPGRVCKSGTPIGMDPQNKKEKLFEVEWLAGGCVLHYKKNLIQNDFYPFKGKAYHEDIIHSYYLRRAGIKLFVNSEARCWLDPISLLNCGSVEFLKQLWCDFRAKQYAMKHFSRFSVRIYFFYVAHYLNWLYKKYRIRFFLRKPRVLHEE